MKKVPPPGTLLQRMYLKERLAPLPVGRFLDVGCGSGWVSQTLLRLGWAGWGIDLYEPSVQEAATTNAAFLSDDRYRAQCMNFLDSPELNAEKFDLVISSMVIEHLDSPSEAAYFQRCRELLTDHGLVIVLVPASPRHWGIEDETAGHFRRYTCESLVERMNQLGWDVPHVAGLTFPLSNLLLGLSNHLLKKHDSRKLSLPLSERTALSGHRKVYLKDEIPGFCGLVLNEKVMILPYLLQKWFRRHPSCLVVYAEGRPHEQSSVTDAADRPAKSRSARRG